MKNAKIQNLLSGFEERQAERAARRAERLSRLRANFARYKASLSELPVASPLRERRQIEAALAGREVRRG